MTIKEKIEIIKKMKENRRASAKYFNQHGNEKLYNEHICEAIVLDSIIRILEDNKYAKKIADIYKD